MKRGDQADLTHAFTRADADTYAALGGAAVSHRVPEPLIGALLSKLLGITSRPRRELPQANADLHTPALLGTPLIARVEITRRGRRSI